MRHQVSESYPPLFAGDKETARSEFEECARIDQANERRRCWRMGG